MVIGLGKLRVQPNGLIKILDGPLSLVQGKVGAAPAAVSAGLPGADPDALIVVDKGLLEVPGLPVETASLPQESKLS